MDFKKYRDDFSYLDKEKVGEDIIYFDSAATTQKPNQVIDAVDNYYKYQNANPHRGSHYLGMLATNAFESARETIRKFINAKRVEEIVYTKNTTESMNLIAYSYALDNLKENDEILITILEHHANLVPWQMVCKKTGAKLVYAYLNDDYSLNYDDLKSKINENTKIVSVTGMSNVTSELIDVKKITKWAHEKGAISIVDAAQLVPHKKVDVADIDCDFLSFSGHKMLSPMGIGVLYGKYELLDKMSPFNLGGEMIEYVHEQNSTFAKPPLKFEAGTQNVGGVIGLKRAIEYIEEIGMGNIYKREDELTKLCYDLIKDTPHLNIYYPKDRPTGSALSFTFDDIHPHDAESILDMDKIAVRSGHHCAMPLHEYLGISATCRASFAFYNTEGEVYKFAESFKKIRKVMGL